MSDRLQTRSIEPRPAEGERGRCYFLVLDGATSSLFHLPPSGMVTVGRGPEADLRLDNTSVSRRHARVIVADDEIRVADLESHNGVRVNGERIEGARRLGSGDVVSIGELTLVLHAGARTAKHRQLLDAAPLGQRFEDELARALEYERPLTLLAIALGSPLSDELCAALAAAVDPLLRRVDIAGWGDDKQLLVLLPELAGDEAIDAARSLAAAIGQHAPSARIGLATCPTDGCDVSTLSSAAHAAAAGAVPGSVLEAARMATEMRLGERTVVVADPAMVRLYDLLRRLAVSPLPVLISGETGVGKENAAFSVHHWSARSAGPFVALNCAAIAESLVESELFGHEKGAFSGALAAKAGLLESADGGTIFLDEIGELSATVQAKLLRVLESRRVLRVGAVRDREIDIRIVAATHRDLEADVRAGRFRKDLFFRLGAATVILPPLRERPRELAALARRFLADASARAGRPAMTLSPPSMQRLATYDWPGNVRELKNVMEYLAAAFPVAELEPWHLPPRIAGTADPAAATENPSPTSPEPSAPPSFRSIAEEVRDLERRRMTEALDAAAGNQTRAAASIGMALRTFQTKLKQFGLAKT